MESVFTTLEQTSRMIETTGENRDFKRSDLEKKKQHLMQAIAATLEECSAQVVSGSALSAGTTERSLTS